MTQTYKLQYRIEHNADCIVVYDVPTCPTCHQSTGAAREIAVIPWNRLQDALLEEGIMVRSVRMPLFAT